MGLFPEISRVWITVDHRLFLWNYMKGNDFLAYEDQDQVIIKCGLVPVQAGVFLEPVQRVLVLATALDILLFGVVYDEKTGDIDLLLTEMSTSSDGWMVNSISGTSDGRIFLGMSNSPDIFELQYAAKERWFGAGVASQCKLVNLTAGVLSHYVPSFLHVFGGRSGNLKFKLYLRKNFLDYVKQISLDESRSLLYCLTEKSTLHVRLSYICVSQDSFFRYTELKQIASTLASFKQ